jgi:hypothetical protein
LQKHAGWVFAYLGAGTALLIFFNFNPITVGGYEKLFVNSELIQKMKEQELQLKNPRWLVVGNYLLGNIPRIIGSQSFSGNYMYPQLEFWKQMDPELKFENDWNRHQHLVFFLAPRESEFKVHSPQSDVVLALLPLGSRQFKMIDPNLILIPKRFLNKTPTYELHQHFDFSAETSCCLIFSKK